MYDVKKDSSILLSKKELRKGKWVLAFLNPDCSHCQLAAKKIGIMQSKNKTLPIYIFILENSRETNSFILEYDLLKNSFTTLEAPLFFSMAGYNQPAIYYINNGYLVKKVSYLSLDQSDIEQWLP